MPLVASHADCTATSDCASGGFCDPFSSPAVCDTGLTFSTNSPSCLCVSEGMDCPAGLGTHWGVGISIGGSPTGQGGQGGGAGQGAVSGVAGSSGAAGTSGAAGSSGAAGAVGGLAGTAGGAGAGGVLNDN